MFWRINTDGTRAAIPLGRLFSGASRTACWIVGGGPSLAALPCAAIARSPAPRFGINLGGARLIRPDFWTSYDPSARFHRSIYLDASIIKFLLPRRAMDLVPETAVKVCECPGALFIDGDRARGYADFIAAGQTGIVDWNDSLLLAIDIAYRLGFRVLYLAGCEMHVRPSAAQTARGRAAGVEYAEREPLDTYLKRCVQAGVSRSEMERVELPRQYHFDEQKPLAAAINTDLHYFRVSQYLRLSRRAMVEAGLELVSVTPDSRLNDYFAYRPAEQVLAELAVEVGDPEQEPTRGLYTGEASRRRPDVGPMRDFRPHHWGKNGEAPQVARGGPDKTASDRSAARRTPEVVVERAARGREDRRRAIEELPEIAVALDEVG